MFTLFELNYWIWFGIAFFLTIIEVMLGGSFFLLWIAFSALFVGILDWLIPNFSWQYQILIFSSVSVVCLLFWKNFIKKRSAKAEHPILNQKSKQFIGKIYVLCEPIVNGTGKIKVGDSVWQVSGPDLSVGTKVQVLNMEGTILVVKSAEQF